MTDVMFRCLVVCDPLCQNGVCLSNNTCQCSDGFQGERCTIPGKLMFLWYQRKYYWNKKTSKYDLFNTLWIIIVIQILIS